jgi:multiple sugar transport system substrate-binding protein
MSQEQGLPHQTQPWRPNRLTRRLAAPVLGAAGTVLAACAGIGGGTPPASGSQPATIRWFTRATYQPAVLEPWLAEWRQAQPQLTVEPIMSPGGTGPAKEKLLTLVAGGESPDVVSAFTAAFLMIDVTQPIEDLVRRDRYDTRRFEPKNFEAAAKYQGKLYMLPQGFGGDAVILVYNRRLLADGGAREPGADWKATWRWDEFRDTLRRTSKREGDRLVQVGLGSYGYFLDTIPKPFGGEWLAADLKSIVSDAPPMIEAYTRYLELVHGDRSTWESPGADLGGGNAFLSGKAAVASAGGAPLSFTKRASEAGIDWAFAPLPVGQGSTATTDMAATHTGLVRDSKVRDASWTWIKWLVDEGRLARLEDRIPNTPALVESWVRQTWAGQEQSRPQVLGAALGFASPMERLFFHPEWSKWSTDIVTPIWDAMRTQQTGVREGLAEAKRQLQRAVDDYERRRPPA